MSIIYDHDQPLSAEERATQIRHLALIGIAGSDSIWKVRRINDCYRSLFEVIARLAHEIEDDLKRLQSALTLVQLAVSGSVLGKDDRDALYIGLDHAMGHAIEIGTRLTALRQGAA